tara:strand:+ start:1379 stop:2032 length:654 start_codon:yes stop_codon:yes gene_type:complete
MSQEFIKRILSSIILVPIALFFIIEGSFLFNFFIALCFTITSLEWYKMSKKKSYNFFGLIFLIISFYSIYMLRNEFNSEYMYLLFITIICVSTDIGGYLFGKLFKGPKLTKISPKKTYSGMIGGYLMSIIAVNFFINSTFSNELIDLTNSTYVFVLLVSSISQLGDILISYFKRLSKVKDTGKIIPGHGGLLDRVDGMIFAFPFSYLILSVNIFSFF